MDFSLTLIEVLAFAGLFQCVSILVYLFFRAGKFSLAFIPFVFFLNLSAALYLDFGAAFFEINDVQLIVVRFWIWMLLCPLSILFILQFADLGKTLSYYGYLSLAPILFSIMGVYVFDVSNEDMQLIYILGAVAATLSLPFIWFKKNLLLEVKSEPSGQERYWMILALIILTIGLISLVYALLSETILYEQYVSIRTILGLTFVYISATYMFRVYPPPIRAITKQAGDQILSKEDKELVEKIRHKLEYEKVYLEAAYSRSDMARELEISESILSKLMNQEFNDNFPTVLNRYRVEEACQLLEETNAPINVVAEEVGFNSLATFNRVFKDQVTETASKYRQKKVKEASRKIA